MPPKAQDQSGQDADSRDVLDQLLNPDDADNQDNTLDAGDNDSVDEGIEQEEKQDADRKKRRPAWEGAVAKQGEAIERLNQELGRSIDASRTTQGQLHALQTLLERQPQGNAGRQPEPQPDVDFDDPQALKSFVTAQGTKIQQLERIVGQLGATTADQTERQQWLAYLEHTVAKSMDVEWSSAIEQQLRGMPVNELATRGVELIGQEARKRRGATADVDEQVRERARSLLTEHLKSTGQYEAVMRGGRMGGSGGNKDLLALTKKYAGNTEGMLRDPDYQKLTGAGQ